MTCLYKIRKENMKMSLMGKKLRRKFSRKESRCVCDNKSTDKRDLVLLTSIFSFREHQVRSCSHFALCVCLSLSFCVYFEPISRLRELSFEEAAWEGTASIMAKHFPLLKKVSYQLYWFMGLS